MQSVLPKPFKLEDNIRRDETPAHVAIREALINLCIHADYTENASLVVRHNANAFIFSNPGTMLVSKEQYYMGGESVCRNKSLQKMFAMLGVAEKAGSGTDKIMKGWRESNWRAPKIDIKQEPDKVVLSMPMESLLSENAKIKLEEKFGITANSFDHNVLSVLALTSDEGFVTNERLRYSLSLHKSQISELLKLMCQNQLLVTQGYGRGMRYYLPEGNLNVFLAEVATQTAKVATEGAKVASSTLETSNNTGSIVATHEEVKVATTDSKVASSKKSRMSYNDLKCLIGSICTDWVELTVISEKSGRDYAYLRNKIIPRMLKDKEIVMMYPGTPNHPKQQYKIKE